MLKSLSIKNYAIIEELNIQFHSGLNIITGETGAGKSIIVGALGMVLGYRAEPGILKDNSTKTIIEAQFENLVEEAYLFLKSNDFDIYEDRSLVVRREVSSSGKSRSFINDTPASLTHLKELTSMLVDQHRQFDNLQLGKSTFQQKIIDTLARNNNLLGIYNTNYNLWSDKSMLLNSLRDKKEEFNKEVDYLQFQYDELKEMKFSANEIEELEEEQKLSAGAEEIKEVLHQIQLDLDGDGKAVNKIVRKLASDLKKFNYNDQIEQLQHRLESIEIELNDISNESLLINEKLVFDSERQEIINERLSMGYKLMKKHNAFSTNRLIEIMNRLEQKLNNVLNIDNEIESTEQEVFVLLENTLKLGKQLTMNRQKQIPVIERFTNELLQKVGMPNAKLKISLITGNSLKINGLDDIDFLFDANKTGSYESVSKVASGGELSRLMLCIKSLVAKSVQLPTLIFDEIDSGISGEAAKQVGIIMKELSQSLQVISITHQAQIASKADVHYYVFKKENEHKEITTQITQLSIEDRVSQIAQMLSGSNPSANAIRNAKELLQE